MKIHSVRQGAIGNIAITDASGPQFLHPETAPVPITATVEAAGLGATCYLTVCDGDQILQRLGPLTVAADQSEQVSFLLPQRRRGAHSLTLELEPDDRLGFDQRRYIAYQTAERPVVWLVTPEDATPDNDLTALLLRNLLAPETLEPQLQPVTLARLGRVRTLRCAAPPNNNAESKDAAGDPV